MGPRMTEISIYGQAPSHSANDDVDRPNFGGNGIGTHFLENYPRNSQDLIGSGMIFHGLRRKNRKLHSKIKV